MKYLKKNVGSIEELDNLIKFYISNKYTLKGYEDNTFYLYRNSYGNLAVHIILLMTTVWFSYGIINMLYLMGSYFMFSIRLSITYNPFNHNNSVQHNRVHDLKPITDFLDDDGQDSSKDDSPIIDFLNHKK